MANWSYLNLSDAPCNPRPDEEVNTDYDRRARVRAVLDSELRNEPDDVCLYNEIEGKFDAAPSFSIGVSPE